jgi:hypothetical protein
MIISPAMFCTLLSNLVSQFFLKDYVLCANNEDYGGQLVRDAKNFFSVVVKYVDLGNQADVLGVLTDDTKNIHGKNTYTFTVFFDADRFHGEAEKLNLAVILAHEICHFVFYYELFLEMGGVSSSSVYSKFKNAISSKHEGSLFEKIFDNHTLSNIRDIPNLIRVLELFPPKHFSKDIITSKIDYRSFFRHFLKHIFKDDVL